MSTRHSGLLTMVILLLRITAAAGQVQFHMPVPRGPEREPHAFADTVSMLFIGDIMMHQAQLNAARRDDGYDFGSYFRNISELIGRHDLTAANMEFTVGTKPYSGYPCFSAPYEILRQSAESGIDIMLFANNHICDKGARGFTNTFAALDSLKLEYPQVLWSGIGKDSISHRKHNPLIVEIQGIRIAIINFTYGTNGISVPPPNKVNMSDTSSIRTLIDRAKHLGADCIIALPHWGEEYMLRHSRRQESLAGWLAGAGADLIIGSHPHVPQDTSVIDGVQTIYSMGNYISNMSAPNTGAGLAVSASIVKYGNGTTRILPVEITYLWCSRAGRKERNFTTVIARDSTLSPRQWILPEDYDKMMYTVRHIEKATGIK